LGHDGEILYRSYSHDATLEAALDEAVAQHGENSIYPAASSSDRTEMSTSVTIHDTDGNIIDLTPRDGEVLVGYHFAVWCTSYVKDSYPELSEQCRMFDERIRALEALDLPGVRLIGFATAYSTNEASVARFRDTRSIDYPLVFDKDATYGSEFGVRSFPHLTVVAPSGEVVYSGDDVPADISGIIKDAARMGP
jgi:peroxiredoxin